MSSAKKSRSFEGLGVSGSGLSSGLLIDTWERPERGV